MLLPAVIGAIGLLSTAVEAAPKGTEFKKVRSQTVAPRNVYSPSNGYFPSPNVYNLTNTSMSTSSRHGTKTVKLYDDNPVATVECGTASVLTLTTTIDVTVFVTATANLTYTEEPCDDDDTATAHRPNDHGYNTHAYDHLPSASTDCDDEDSPGYAGPKTTTVVEEYPVNETGHAPHYTNVSSWSTTLGTQSLPSGYDDLSASPTRQPEAFYNPPFGGSNNIYTEASEYLQPYGPSKPYDDGTSSATPTGDSAATYTLHFAGSSATYAAPSESTEAYVDQPLYATPSSHSEAVYTLPFGGPNNTYAAPSGTSEPYGSGEAYVEPSSVSSTDDYPAIEYTSIPIASSSISTSTLSSSEPAYDVPIPVETSESLAYYPIAPSSSSSTPGMTLVSSSSSEGPWYSDMPSYY
ncbi:hypothetical protein B0J13DRAFT_615553 [Dactylonectria estremocensis]|uniref:Uncharacterized protein n=1 Tax=Dactylonectria estremocensis TaxID=1079267 RepID=A0A9P9JIR6_9HYPO|nr:hypothetical protein B0J13DRAFT_615553 [Dactylonectria estremocensis]